MALPSPFQQLTNKVQQGYQRWIDQRIPPRSDVTLTQKNIFIFPNRQAIYYFILVALIWLGATNYESNLAFALSFLLIGLFVVGILHTFNNVAGLRIQALQAKPVFAGEFTQVNLQLSRNPDSLPKHAISLAWDKQHALNTSLATINSEKLSVAVQPQQRGWYRPGRLVITSVYPLGIIRCWSHIDLDVAILTYPKPIYGADIPPVSLANSGDEDQQTEKQGMENFDSLQDYQAGVSLRQISWKHYAKGQGLKSKRYVDYYDQQIWMRWDDFNLPVEARLSNFCYWALQFEKNNKPYGLLMPALEIKPGLGIAHQQQVLRALALYGIQKPDSGSYQSESGVAVT